MSTSKTSLWKWFVISLNTTDSTEFWRKHSLPLRLLANDAITSYYCHLVRHLPLESDIMMMTKSPSRSGNGCSVCKLLGKHRLMPSHSRRSGSKVHFPIGITSDLDRILRNKRRDPPETSPCCTHLSKNACLVLIYWRHLIHIQSKMPTQDRTVVTPVVQLLRYGPEPYYRYLLSQIIRWHDARRSRSLYSLDIPR